MVVNTVQLSTVFVVFFLYREKNCTLSALLAEVIQYTCASAEDSVSGGVSRPILENTFIHYYVQKNIFSTNNSHYKI